MTVALCFTLGYVFCAVALALRLAGREAERDELKAERDRLRAALVKISEQKYWHHDGTRVTNAHALDIARAALAREGGAQ